MIVYINRHRMSRNFFGHGICPDEALLPAPTLSPSPMQAVHKRFSRSQVPGQAHPASLPATAPFKCGIFDT